VTIILAILMRATGIVYEPEEPAITVEFARLDVYACWEHETFYVMRKPAP
jgi:hypothetical protein